VLFQCFLVLLLNNWQSRKPRLFKALASTEGLSSEKLRVIRVLVALRYNLEE
jgi:hypothetical protein